MWATCILSAESLDAIVDLGLCAKPKEACGLLMPAWPTVLTLENTSPEPFDSCTIEREELVHGLHRWINLRADAGLEFPSKNGVPDFAQVDVVVWHTHPSGHVGPSREDLRNRIPGARNLVVTLGGPDHGTASFY